MRDRDFQQHNQWMPDDEPVIPFARQRARLTWRERYAVAIPIASDGAYASLGFCEPLVELLLCQRRLSAHSGIELSL